MLHAMLVALAVVLLACSCDGYTPPGSSKMQSGAKLQKVAASVICAASLFAPALTSPAFARQPKQIVRSDSSASSAFFKSEDAIAQATDMYKTTDASWRDAQRDIGDSFRKITRGVGTFKDIDRDIKQIVARMNKLVTIGDNAIVVVTAEIDALTLSTSAKYEAADASSQKLDRPARTADLFKKAQNEAATLARDQIALKVLTDANKEACKALDKSKDVLAVVEAVGAEADAGIAQQTSGLAAMKEGFAASEGVCKDTITGCGANGKVGIAQFKEGTNDVVAAQNKFYKVLQQLDADIRAVDLVRSDLGRAVDSLAREKESIGVWQEDNKLQLKNGKSSLEQYLAEMTGISSTLEQKSTQFAKQYESIVGKDRKQKDTNKASFNQVGQNVRKVQTELEKAAQLSASAERLFIQAREKGEKEAQKYMKAPKAPKASAAAALKTPPTPSSSTPSTSSTSASSSSSSSSNSVPKAASAPVA